MGQIRNPASLHPQLCVLDKQKRQTNINIFENFLYIFNICNFGGLKKFISKIMKMAGLRLIDDNGDGL